jgi:hypothetical protein
METPLWTVVYGRAGHHHIDTTVTISGIHNNAKLNCEVISTDRKGHTSIEIGMIQFWNSVSALETNLGSG